MQVEWCVHNEKFKTRDVVDACVTDTGGSIRTTRYACLEHCDLCARNAFVLVDNQIVSGTSSTDLLQRVRLICSKKPPFGDGGSHHAP